MCYKSRPSRTPKFYHFVSNTNYEPLHYLIFAILLVFLHFIFGLLGWKIPQFINGIKIRSKNDSEDQILCRRHIAKLCTVPTDSLNRLSLTIRLPYMSYFTFGRYNTWFCLLHTCIMWLGTLQHSEGFQKRYNLCAICSAQSGRLNSPPPPPKRLAISVHVRNKKCRQDFWRGDTSWKM